MVTQKTFIKLDDVPTHTKAAATKYKNACIAKGKADAAKKAKLDGLIDSMKENKVKAVKVDIGEGKYKIFTLESEDKLKENVVSEPEPAPTDDAQ